MTAKQMAEVLARIEAERAQQCVVQVRLVAGATLSMFVKDEVTAHAIVDSYVERDPWIDFVTADGGWVRLPYSTVDGVGYQTGASWRSPI